jgi:hypothetical protein
MVSNWDVLTKIALNLLSRHQNPEAGQTTDAAAPSGDKEQ